MDRKITKKTLEIDILFISSVFCNKKNIFSNNLYNNSNIYRIYFYGGGLLYEKNKN